MNQVRVGAIGCGYWGPNLIRNFMELPTSKLVAIADKKPERLQQAKTWYPGLKVTANYEDLFKMNLDAVVIATPPATHFEIARQCLLNGLNVLVEKPLTLDSRHSEELIHIAEMNDRILMVGHTFEYNPAVLMLKQIIDRGEIGDVYYVDMVRANLGLFQRRLNVLWDLAPHDLSIILHLLGEMPTSISAHGGDCVLRGVQDIVYMHLSFPNNVIVHIQSSWLSPRKIRRTTVVGSQKMVVYDDIEEERIKIYDKGVNPPAYTETLEEFHWSYRNGDVVTPHINFTEPLRAECQHFIESIINHTTPRTDGCNGLRVVQLLEAAERSLHNGGTPEYLTSTLDVAAVGD
jgi:predicted dehydrogenase